MFQTDLVRDGRRAAGGCEPSVSAQNVTRSLMFSVSLCFCGGTDLSLPELCW